MTRYYDPIIGQFISPDGFDYLKPDTVGGVNLYTYCGFDPVNNVDSTGNSFILALIIGAVAGAVIGATVNGVKAYNEGARGWNLAGSIVSGAVVGAVVGGVIGAGAGAFAGGGAALAIAGGGTASAGAAVTAGAVVTAALQGLTIGAVVSAGIVGANLLFLKGNGPRLGHNQYENKQIDSLCKQFNLTKVQRRILHEYITGQNLSYQEIKRIIIELFFN